MNFKYSDDKTVGFLMNLTIWKNRLLDLNNFKDLDDPKVGFQWFQLFRRPDIWFSKISRIWTIRRFDFQDLHGVQRFWRPRRFDFVNVVWVLKILNTSQLNFKKTCIWILWFRTTQILDFDVFIDFEDLGEPTFGF